MIYDDYLKILKKTDFIPSFFYEKKAGNDIFAIFVFESVLVVNIIH